MEIRPYLPQDYEAVADLLKRHGWHNIPPSFDNLALVYENSGIKGFIWAVIGGKSAYIDYFTIDQAERSKEDIEGAGKEAFILFYRFLQTLRSIGIERLYGILNDTPVGLKMAKLCCAAGGKAFNARYSIYGDLEQIVTSFKEASHGRRNNDNN